MRVRHRILLLVAAATGAPAPVTAQEAPEFGLRVVEDTLENGLRLLVVPRPGIPIASFVVKYRVGSVNEPPGKTGVAHLLEHLLFKGTTTVGTMDHEAERPLMAEMDRLFDTVRVLRGPPVVDTLRIRSLTEEIRALEEESSRFVRSNEFDQLLREQGARNLNATTTVESTTYFVELPSNRAELWFILEGDRMRNPVFREFYTEREVVEEERRLRLENNAGGLLYEAHLAAAFQVHPYGTPVVGHMDDIRHLSREDVRTFFRRHYGPNNAVVVVAGDVDPRRIRRWAQRYLGGVPRGEAPPPVRSVEPPQRGQRRVEVVFDAEPSLRMGWKVPSASSEDAPSLYMLMSILTGGRSSRLYNRLVLEDRIASGVSASIEPGRLYPGLFSIQASPLHPHSPREVEMAIEEELNRLRLVPPSEREIQQVRNQLEASQIRRLRSNFGLALQLAEAASLSGDWREAFESTQELMEVTPEDVQRVVRRYFRKEHRTVATLVRPEGEVGGGR